MSAVTTGAPRQPTSTRRLRTAVRGLRSARGALVVYVAALVVAFGILVAWSRHLWLITEDWVYFAQYQQALRNGDLGSFLFDQYRGHWITTTSVLHELAYQLAGLRHYLPYLLPTFFAMCAVSVLLRVVMRRASVTPWLATAFAVLALFLAVGSENLAKAWQFQFTGGIMFGLGQIVLSDHDGPVGRRDVLAIGCGVLGLMTSGLAILFAGTTALSLCMRSRFVALAVNIVPLILVYVPWFLLYGRDWGGDERAKPSQIGHVVRTSWHVLDAAVDSVLRTSILGGLAIVVLVVGAFLVRVPWRRRGYAPVVAMAVGAPVFLLFAGVESIGSLELRPVRYQQVVAVLLLPLAAVVISRVVERRFTMRLLVLALVVVLAVANALALRDGIDGYKRVNDILEPEFLAMASSPLLAHLPDDAHLSQPLLANVDAATVRRLVREGSVATDAGIPAAVRFGVDVDLGVGVDAPRAHGDGVPAQVRSGTSPGLVVDSRGCVTRRAPDGPARLVLAVPGPTHLPIRSRRGGTLELVVREPVTGLEQPKSTQLPAGRSALRIDLRDVDVTVELPDGVTRVCGLAP